METKLEYSRYWIALDQDGRPNVGQVVNRQYKPKTGRWLELALRPCCSIKVAIGTFSDSPIFTINCGGDSARAIGTGYGSVAEAVENLNQNYSALGTWSADDTYFYLKGVFCPNATLELIYD